MKRVREAAGTDMVALTLFDVVERDPSEVRAA
jgi:hypothetical protein